MLAAISYPPIPIVDLGPLSLSLHGVFAGIGFAGGAYLATREVRRRGFPIDMWMSVLTWALVGAILGARFFTIPAHLGDPGFDFWAAINPAGFYSILGGFAGGVLGGWLRLRTLGMPFRPYADMAAFGMALGTVIGRIGDLAIVEHLGKPTDFFLGYTIKGGYDVAPQHDPLECLPEGAICGTFHFTPLYDLLLAGVLLLFLYWLRRAWTARHYGQLFGVWVAWYGFQRFALDFVRIGSGDAMLGPLTWSQWVGLSGGVFGLLLIWLFRRYSPRVSSEQDVVFGAAAPGVPEAEQAEPTTPSG